MSFSVVVLGKLPPTCGQVSTLNLWLLAGLRERGINLSICTDAMFPRKLAVKADDRSDLKERLAALLPDVRIDYAAHLAGELFLPFSELAFVSFLAAARTLVADQRPSVIFSHYLEPYALAGAQISREFGIPHVVTHAGSDIARLCKTEPVRDVYRAAFSENCHFVAKTELAAGIFADIPRLSVSPYLPDPRHFAFVGDDERLRSRADPLFGFYGKFVNGKNLDRLVAAFRIYRERHGTGRLVLMGGDIGGGFRIDEVVGEADRPYISVRPFIPNWEIPAFLNSLSCLVYTKAGYRVPQHAAIIMREAAACQVPVLATAESFAGSPAGLADMARVTMVDAHADPATLAEAMAAQVAEPPAPRPGAARAAYFSQGYGDYVDSWYDCLATAGGIAR